MQPYQLSGEVMKRKSEQPIRLLKKVASIGTGVAGGVAGKSIMKKIFPILAGGFTTANTIKALKGVHPKIGEFIENAMNSGRSFEEIKDFLSEKASTAEKERPQSLFEKLTEGLDTSSLDPGSQKEMSFMQMIADQMEGKGKTIKDPAVKKLKKKIQNILKGKGSLATGFMQEAPEAEMTQPMMQQPQMQAAQPGAGQQALMAILQKIQAQRGL